MSVVRALRRVSLVALPLLGCAGPSLAELAVGQPAPEFRLRDLDGVELSLSELAGKTVVIEFVNPNCPFSRRHSKSKTLQSISERYPEVVFVGINSTNPEHGDYLPPAEQKAFHAGNGTTYRILEDPTGQTGRAYGAKSTPHLFVIDAAGKLAYAGAMDDDPRGRGASVNYVDSALAALAAGGRPEPATTRPYGCSMKY
jgi:peroxiredoxin